MGGTHWEAGTDLNYLKELAGYWYHTYDWRARGGPQSIRSLQNQGKGPIRFRSSAGLSENLGRMAWIGVAPSPNNSASALTWVKEEVKKWTGSSKVPAAFALFPADISRPPREWAERFFNVQRWIEMPRGGHFAAMEEPELLADDIHMPRTRFHDLRHFFASS